MRSLENKRNDKDEPISIILIDIDNFKKFNNDHSHKIADQILTKIGEDLIEDKRSSDEVYRYHLRGDEFLIICKKTSSSNAFKAPENKRKIIEGTDFDIDEKTFKCTVRCGVTVYKKDESASLVFKRVEDALMTAKKTDNKNCSVLRR